MLNILRKKGVAKKILWVIAVIIILSFGVFGTASYLGNNNPSAGYAGKIFGKNVKVEEFTKVYEQTRIDSIVKFGDNYSKILPFLNLETEAWDRLILLHEANKRKIKVADKDVVKTIEQYPFFKRNDQFDTLLYNDILRYVFHVKPRAFEEGVRDSLKYIQLFKEETAQVTITDEEILEGYKKQNEKVQVSYVLLSPEEFTANIPFDEGKAREFYEAHREEFMMPPTINIEYLDLSFTQNSEELDKNSVRARADVIYQDLLQKPNLEETSKQHNVPFKETGFFNLNEPNANLNWPFDVLAKLLALDKGTVSEPLEIPTGVIIARLKDTKESYIASYDEAQEKIKEAYLKEEAFAIARDKGKEVNKTILEKYNSSNTKDFAQIAKDLNLNLFQTPLFARGEYLPNIGLAKEFQDTAFSLTNEKKISEPVETAKGVCILHLDSYLGIDEEKYKQEKETIAQELLQEKKNSAFNDFLTHLRIQANLQDYISKDKNQ